MASQVTAPRVTIGLPVFDGEHYLAAAIDSLLAQDFTDFELLIADNGSTDGTLRIAQEAAARDYRVTVHGSPVNRGAAWNYNRLVDLARGKYFKWAAHDDLVRPTFLSRCVEVLDGDPEVVLAYTRAQGIDQAGEAARSYEVRKDAGDRSAMVRARSILLDPSPCYESFGLMRTEQLRRTRRIGAYTSSDRSLFLELCLTGRFHEVPEILFLHRLHEERSVRRYSDDRARNEWFDPSWSGRPSAPRWRLLKEYATSAGRVSIGPLQRAQVSALLARWALANRGVLSREAVSLLLGRATATTSGPNSPKAARK